MIFYDYNDAEIIIYKIWDSRRNPVNLEIIWMHEALEHYNFSELNGKRVLVKGCSEEDIPENAYIELVEKLKPLVKSLMFGEACSNVPIFKN